jgi:hypothetical protein
MAVLDVPGCGTVVRLFSYVHVLVRLGHEGEQLLEAFRAGEGVDLIGESVRPVMQELIETKRPSGSGPAVMSAHSPGD